MDFPLSGQLSSSHQSWTFFVPANRMRDWPGEGGDPSIDLPFGNHLSGAVIIGASFLLLMSVVLGL